MGGAQRKSDNGAAGSVSGLLFLGGRAGHGFTKLSWQGSRCGARLFVHGHRLTSAAALKIALTGPGRLGLA